MTVVLREPHKSPVQCTELEQAANTAGDCPVESMDWEPVLCSWSSQTFVLGCSCPAA